MEVGMDFLDLLQPDMSRKILMYLDDVSDIVRASAVSRGWQRLVIENGLSKQLCFKMFPHLSGIFSIVEVNNSEMNEHNVACGSSTDSKSLQRDHRVYAHLVHASTSFLMRNCISSAIIASSTDNDPEESINNTLESRDVVARRASYWSSKGQFKPDVPETLTYRLVSNLCVITEINIRPFQAFFQPDSPIYSAKAVRFRFGHLKHVMEDSRSDLVRESHCGSANETFIWTYTSPEFPMSQENDLQKFKLPEPVLCIGGILQIELLGRIQRQETDGLFYICVSHVQVIGRPLSPSFDIEILEPSGGLLLKCNRQAKTYNQLCMLENEQRTILPTYLERRVIELRQIVNMLRGNVVQGEYYAWGEEEDESDEEFVE